MSSKAWPTTRATNPKSWRTSVAPDLGTAEELLTVNFNLQQLPEDDPYRVEVTAELTLLSQPFRADR